MNSPIEDIKDYMVSGGWTLGTDLFVSFEPNSPDTVITIYNAPGQIEACLDKSHVEQVGFQIRSRSTTWLAAHSELSAAMAYLDFSEPGTINGTLYSTILPQGLPIDLEADDRQRRIVVQNYRVLRQTL